MNNLLLLHEDRQLIDKELVKRLFLDSPAFYNVRENHQLIALIEAHFGTRDDNTIVRLDRECTYISLSGTSDAALQAALILQRQLPTPLRIMDSGYSFNLKLSRFTSVEELNAAIALGLYE